MNNQVNLVSQKQKVRHQQGFASLLFVLLIGLSLVIIVLGVFITLRGLQDSAITSHAQTQAEERSTIGVKALSNFLYSKTDTQISSITGGTITDKNGTLTGTANSTVATYAKSATCPTGAVTQYCFDVTASSGGASATIRTVYQKATTLSSTTLTGSVFAGGLVTAGSAKFTGNTSTNPITLSVGGTYSGQVCANIGCTQFVDNSSLLANGLQIVAYTPTTFITADDLKPYSNYQFTASGATCNKLNLYSGTTAVSTPTSISCSSFSGISYNSSSASWTIDPSKTLPVGVLWFDTDVVINLKSGSTLVNTIISKGSVSVTSPNSGTINNYAPYYYYSTTNADHLTRVCGTTAAANIPTQYCNSDGSFNTGFATFPGNIANILFLTNNQLSLDAANNAVLNYYGNIIASYGAGGTGSASGKFTGTGTINITGNLVIAGTTNTTQMTGNISIDLSNSTAASSSVIPSYTYANGLRFIKYM
ncbi:hypothetical protein E0H86_03340 [Acinetobacter sp. ANC 4635]|uniref:hypothetical protein n=1 Tax=Acinetobacter sp. ANC 4635 TaxID=2529846 RepID=UPI001040AD63|nr:hypothetical protein [Acinetobacter sp. ANC 4635]TCB32503.1 hypothetical protein E0H86_03340 [Acinetobacter sp. ANC 4635]